MEEGFWGSKMMNLNKPKFLITALVSSATGCLAGVYAIMVKVVCQACSFSIFQTGFRPDKYELLFCPTLIGPAYLLQSNTTKIEIVILFIAAILQNAFLYLIVSLVFILTMDGVFSLTNKMKNL